MCSHRDSFQHWPVGALNVFFCYTAKKRRTMSSQIDQWYSQVIVVQTKKFFQYLQQVLISNEPFSWQWTSNKSLGTSIKSGDPYKFIEVPSRANRQLGSGPCWVSRAFVPIFPWFTCTRMVQMKWEGVSVFWREFFLFFAGNFSGFRREFFCFSARICSV